MKRAYADTADGQMNYLSAGSGDPVIFIHQAACSSVEYVRVLPFVAGQYRAIAPDLPGHGHSDDRAREYSIEDYAQCVVGFMDALGLKKASLAGHHGAAYIVTEMAVRFPERVDKVILQDSPFYKKPKGGLVLLGLYQCQYLELKRDGSHLIKEWDYLKEYSPDTPLEILQMYVIAKLQAGPAGVEYYRAVAKYDNTEKLALISQPALLIAGRNEYFVRNIQELQKRIPRSKTVLIEGADLYVSQTHPQQYADAILDFLRNPPA